MNEPAEPNYVSISPRSPQPPEMPASQPLGVLAYAPPAVRRVSPVWAKICMPLALVYAGITLFLLMFALLGNSYFDYYIDPAVLYGPLLLTSPLGIFAFIAGVLGHYTPRGRVNAGPAVWTVSCTPGGIAAIGLILCLFTQRYSHQFLLVGGTIFAINIVLVVILNGRILKASDIEQKFDH